MKYITITGSNVAKYTGHNQYQTLEKTINELLSKNGIRDRYIPKSNIEERLRSLSDTQRESLAQELNVPPETSISSLESLIKSQIMKGSYASSITEEQSKQQIETKIQNKPMLQLVSESIQHDLRMRRGKKKESMNLDTIQTTKQITITERNSRMYTRELYRCDDYCILLKGKVDGIAGDTVVETKNRTRRLFKELREYERVQLECYMYLTGYDKSILTEHYNDTNHCIEYSHNEEFWQECIEKTIHFIETHIRPYLQES